MEPLAASCVSGDVPPITRVFADVVRRQPQEVAIRTVRESWTYADLDRASTSLGNAVAECGLAPEARVAFSVPRGPLELVAILGILKAGLAYLPLDPTHPLERLRYMLEDSACELILTAGGTLASELSRGRMVLSFDQPSAMRQQPSGAPRHARHAGSLAYLLYTSGSTGAPKGVLIEDRGVVLLAESLGRVYGTQRPWRQYRFFSPSADASVHEIFVCLLNGWELFIDPHGPSMLSPDRLLDLLSTYRVDSLITTPSYLLAATPRPRLYPGTITVAGEILPPTLARQWAPHHRLFNAYGPTEITVAATIGEISPSNAHDITLGFPLPHVAVTIIRDGVAVPDGEVGEIQLGGPSIARGYWNRDTLTAAAFSGPPTPFAAHSYYRTGDLGCVRPDGRIEFHGRRDRQVKISGHRVELEEIEAHIRHLVPGISECGVVAFGEPPGQRLAAFVASPMQVQSRAVRQALESVVPRALIPSIVSQLPALPRLPSTKLDRRGLEIAAAALAAGPQGLRGLLRSLWCELLEVEGVNDDDDFFALGGDSARASQLVARTRDRVNAEIALRVIFDHSTFRDYHAAIAEAQARR